MEAKLLSAGTLIEELKTSQDVRLSLPPPHHLSLCQPPSQEELSLGKLAFSLTVDKVVTLCVQTRNVLEITLAWTFDLTCFDCV
jgi:hypothetical protein